MRRITPLSFQHISGYRQTESQIQMPLLQGQHTEKSSTTQYSYQMSKIDDVLTLKKSSQSKFLKFCSFMQHMLPPLHPQSDVLVVWNLLMLLIIFYYYIVIPIFILITNFYQDGLYEQVFIYIDIAITILFFIDMLAFRSRTSFYQNERLITSYPLIYKKYLNLQFALDLITIIGNIIYVTIPTQVYIRLLVIFKVYAYIDINQKIQIKLIVYPYLLVFYRFFRLVAFIVIVTSLAACIYFALDYSYYREYGDYYEYGLLWLTGSASVFQKNLIIYSGWPTWYDYAMYYSVQTIAGCGYGNITPRNSPQVLYCNVIILTFFIMYIWFESRIYAIIQELNERSQKKEQNMRDYHTYVDQNEVQADKKKKSKFYIQSYFRRSDQDDTFLEIYELLSEKLKIQMKLRYHSQIYENLPIMKQIFYEECYLTGFAKSIIQSMKVKYLSTGEVIFEPNQTSNFKLILIIRGKLHTINPYLQNQKVYNQWNYLGQRQFFFSGLNNNLTKCLTFTKFCYFQRSQFRQIIKQHQQQNQILQQLLDGVYIDGKQGKEFGLECNLCEKPHIQHFCEVHEKWKRRISRFARKNQPQLHERKPYKRRVSASKKIAKQYPIQSIQIDKYQRSTKYHPIYNLKDPK